MTVLFWQPQTESTASPGPLMLQAYETLKTGTLYVRYRKDNPVEAAGIDNYWLGGERPADARTATGRALLGWADVYRGI